MIQQRITQDNPDEHVWLTVECEGRPTISIDIGNGHGRRFMSVRIDGMTHHSMLLDTKELGPRSGDEWKNHRFCPFCGEEILMVSSRPHVCAET